MLIKNISASSPIRVKVGDIEVVIFRIGERSSKIGVAAPKDMPIIIENDETVKSRR
ncbi:Global regulator protein family protein [Paracoccus alcaliphilus]|uniref:Global regulator protein family protein n=1 Tax=Paracoccus alcaliphilus TaxID=34002 RepID=A0A1H8K4B7_9RHOB|nr:carbon storage regulator [Paracoccus alcaliphilus]WCR17519.1 carbon storage regulator [Paracoccus alcaliphilus]SEN87258.1 Global regulator protein family protein [Paracoccus alcaliphilus]